MNEDTDAVHTALVNEEYLYRECESAANYAGFTADSEDEFFETLAAEIRALAESNRDLIPGYSYTEPIDYELVDWEEIARTYSYDSYRITIEDD